MFGNDLIGHQLRLLVQWAEDHPSILIIIRSQLSWDWLDMESKSHLETFDVPRNVILDNGNVTIPKWWMESLSE